MRHHSDERASVCLNCEQEGNSLTTCRQILHHNDCNAFQWKTFASTKKQLPSCCLELLGLQTQYYLAGDKEGQVKEPYVTGYMVPYSENLWKDWLKHFTLQSGCEYTIRTGVQKNEESRERGAIKLQGKLCSYTSTWTRTYTCLRGGEGKFKPLKLSKKNRCSIGSRRYGCKAVLHIRLLTISDGSTALEIKVPTIDAHLPTHNPSSITDQMCLKPLPELESKVLELVQESLLGQRALRMSLKTWVERELIPRHIQDGVIDEQPSQYNRAYYPNAEDIRVMVKKAITQERSSLFDQGAVLQLLQEEKETHQLKFFFRQYSKDESQ